MNDTLNGVGIHGTPINGVAKPEQVDHPLHYGGPDNLYEVIKVLRAWGLLSNFCLGNTVKYIARAGKKDSAAELEDLKKARWYLDYEIKHREDTTLSKEWQAIALGVNLTGGAVTIAHAYKRAGKKCRSDLRSKIREADKASRQTKAGGYNK